MAGGRATELKDWRRLDAGNVTSFGVDGAGELYLTISSGRVFRLAP